MNRLAVLAHPRLCEDLARLIVEMIMPDFGIEFFHRFMVSDGWRHPQRHGFCILCARWEDAFVLTCQARRIYGPYVRNLSFRAITGDGYPDKRWVSLHVSFYT